MGIGSKIVGSALALGLAANYSNLCLEAFGTVRNSVITIELTRIDQQLRQHEIMTWGETAGASEGSYPGDGTDPEADQEAFVQFMAEAFDTPGRDPSKDTFGNVWQYTRFSDGYRILSMGGDHQEGTEDDQWLERHGTNCEMNRSLEDIANVMEEKAKELKQAQEELLEEVQRVADETAEDIEDAEGEGEESEDADSEDSGDEPPEEPAGTSAASARPASKGDGKVGAASAKPASKGAGAVGAASARPASADAGATAAASAKPASKGAGGTQAASAAPKAPPPPPPPRLTAKQRRKALFSLQAGKSMLMNKRVDKARTYFQRVINDFPNTSHAAEAQRRLGELGG